MVVNALCRAPRSATIVPMNDFVYRWFRLVPAYAVGYFFSYGLRSVNAVIAPELMHELHVSTTGMGLLTSAYFLAFGLFQLPLGLLLDRFGPRRVEITLLMVAAAGCCVFAVGTTLEVLAIGRALIGLGVSACLMAAFKAFAQWYPPERQASLAATIMVAGGMGALIASVPVEAALPALGWRGVFWVVGFLLVLTCGLLTTVPEKALVAKGESFAVQLRSLVIIYRSPAFWRFAPQGCMALGGFMAIQGLWAVPWLMDVNGLSRGQAAHILFLVSVAMLAGFLFVALCSGWLGRRGVSPMALLCFGMGLSLLAQIAISMDMFSPVWLWPLLGFSFSLGNISYPQLSALFPVALSGRVNTALNLVVFIGAFGLQWGMGVLADVFGSSGIQSTSALRATFLVLLAAQFLSFIWFLLPFRRPI